MSSSVIRPNSAPHASTIRMVFTWRVSAKGACSDGNGGCTPHTRCATIPDKRRKNHGVIDAPEIEHFDPEQRSRCRRAEHRREAGADPANHQPPPILVAKAQDVGEQTRQGGANLRGRSLFTDGPAKRQRDQGGAQLDGRDEPIGTAGSPVNRGDHRLCPASVSNFELSR
jgi:hypothetical protein